MSNENQLPAGYWEVSTGETNYLVGQIATLLDAIISDDRQAKAAKDIAKNLIWERKNRMDGEVARLFEQETI